MNGMMIPGVLWTADVNRGVQPLLLLKVNRHLTRPAGSKEFRLLY